MGRIVFLAATFVAYVIVMFTLASIPDYVLQEAIDATNTAAVD